LVTRSALILGLNEVPQQLFGLRQELMEWWVKEPDDDGTLAHDAQYLHEVLGLELF
jgi:hypothetical protein